MDFSRLYYIKFLMISEYTVNNVWIIFFEMMSRTVRILREPNRTASLWSPNQIACDQAQLCFMPDVQNFTTLAEACREIFELTRRGLQTLACLHRIRVHSTLCRYSFRYRTNPYIKLTTLRNVIRLSLGACAAEIGTGSRRLMSRAEIF